MQTRQAIGFIAAGAVAITLGGGFAAANAEPFGSSELDPTSVLPHTPNIGVPPTSTQGLDADAAPSNGLQLYQGTFGLGKFWLFLNTDGLRIITVDNPEAAPPDAVEGTHAAPAPEQPSTAPGEDAPGQVPSETPTAPTAEPATPAPESTPPTDAAPAKDAQTAGPAPSGDASTDTGE